MKDVIFFDLDGTLTKSEEGIIAASNNALRELGMPVPAKKDLFYFRKGCEKRKLEFLYKYDRKVKKE